MKKFLYAIRPFCIYAFFVLLYYFFDSYLLVKYNTQLALGIFISIPLYFLYYIIGAFILGFIFGKIAQKRFASDKVLHCVLLAVFTFAVMIIIGGIRGIFYNMNFHNGMLVRDFIWGITFGETHDISLITLISFLAGELYEYFRQKRKEKN